MPEEDDIRRSKVIRLDPFSGRASNRVAEFAPEAGIPVVTVDCLPHQPLLGHASALRAFAAYPVAALDTTCAGDRFRADIDCTRTPSALNASSYDETPEFMRSRKEPARAAGHVIRQ